MLTAAGVDRILRRRRAARAAAATRGAGAGGVRGDRLRPHRRAAAVAQHWSGLPASGTSSPRSPPPAGWAPTCRAPLRELARATGRRPARAGWLPTWQVAHDTGAGLAAAMRAAADAIRAERRTTRLVATELAAAHATARMLAVLPVGVARCSGPGVGGDPVGFLLGTHPGAGRAWRPASGSPSPGCSWLDRIADRVLRRRDRPAPCSSRRLRRRAVLLVLASPDPALAQRPARRTGAAGAGRACCAAASRSRGRVSAAGRWWVGRSGWSPARVGAERGLGGPRPGRGPRRRTPPRAAAAGPAAGGRPARLLPRGGRGAGRGASSAVGRAVGGPVGEEFLVLHHRLAVGVDPAQVWALCGASPPARSARARGRPGPRVRCSVGRAVHQLVRRAARAARRPRSRREPAASR